MSARHSERRLELEVRAAEALREALKTITDDEEAIADTVEGETNLHEAIASVLDDMAHDEALVEALDNRIGGMKARQNRLCDRIAARRSAIERAMSLAELQKLELPEATLSLRKVAPKLEIYDANALPQQFIKTTTVQTLDKALLHEAAKHGEIPGARLGNGSISLAIRRA